MELCTQDLRSNFPKNVAQANMWTSVQCQNPKLKFQINVKFQMNQLASIHKWLFVTISASICGM